MLDAICDVLKLAYKRNWISTRDGNASCRLLGQDFFYITPTAVKKQSLTSEMMVKIYLKEQIETGHPYKPSGEKYLHYLFQKNIQQDRSVLHLHPTYTIAAMYAGIDLQKLCQDFPEINRYTTVGPNVPLIPPISKELGDESAKAFGLDEQGNIKCDIVGLDRHGVVSVGKDIWTAFEHCERLEHICQIVLASGIRI
jgi:ribulose-5-phosphate 4-epimerase/fuculose-1-phosphate aldolase